MSDTKLPEVPHEDSASSPRPDPVKSYVLQWQRLLDTQIGRYVDPAGKRILVVGCGQGTEIVWALRKNARFVVGVDPRGYDSGLAGSIMKDLGQEEAARRYAMITGTVESLPAATEPFDAVISLNVFEHIFDLSRNLSALRPLMKTGSRIAIFTDPLFYSSAGSHLHLEPWAHLIEKQETLKARVSPGLWNEYRTGLNGMTITHFLGAVREAGLVLLNLHIVRDRALNDLARLLPAIPPGIKPMDLCLEGIGAELTFPDCM